MSDAKEYKQQSKLVAAFFVNSVYFAGEQQSVTLGRNTDSIAPAKLLPDGSAVAIDVNQRADGLLLTKKTHNLSTHAKVVVRCFVPFSNIKCLEYGLAE
jgi:hypothetical protein